MHMLYLASGGARILILSTPKNFKALINNFNKEIIFNN